MENTKQVVVVTGAGRGLGRAISEEFLRSGATVVLTGRDERELDRTLAELSVGSDRAHRRRLDVTVEDEIKAVMDWVAKTFGRIDVLVNNAGITGPTAPLHQITRQQWEDVIAVNLTGAFLCAKWALPSMIERREGCIINLASVASRLAYKLRSPYASSKWAIIGLTKTLAAEVGPYNVRVNAICPGPVYGPRMQSVIERRAAELKQTASDIEAEYRQNTALNRFVEPEHIAKLALFLASDAGKSTTGAAFDMTAGFHL